MTRRTKKRIFYCTLLCTTAIVSAGLPVRQAWGIDEGSQIKQDPPFYGKSSKRYSSLDLSYIQFEAEGLHEGNAQAMGLALTTGYRLSGIVSLEGGLNWIPFCTGSFPLPLPLSWMPEERSVYLNLGAGLRFNLVDHYTNEIVPWISIWRMGHGVLGDYSVSGKGNSFAVGVQGSPRDGRNWQIALRVHHLTGNLEIAEGMDSRSYRDTRIQAIELLVHISGD